MAFGSFIHRILELGVEAKSLDALLQIAEQERSNYKFGKEYEPKIEVCLRNFLRFNAQLCEAGRTEGWFTHEIEPGLFSNGIIDRVVKGREGGILVIDYKTAKREKTKFDLSQDKQGLTYVDAMSNELGLAVEKITFGHYYPLTNNFITVRYTRAQVAKNRKDTIREAWNIRKAKTADLQPMENQFCNWCQFKSGCSIHTPQPLIEETLKNATKQPKRKK
jgi:CRISPR/Cas system-associated exonuclease Cas4 (RecB family)